MYLYSLYCICESRLLIAPPSGTPLFLEVVVALLYKEDSLETVVLVCIFLTACCCAYLISLRIDALDSAMVHLTPVPESDLSFDKRRLKKYYGSTFSDQLPGPYGTAVLYCDRTRPVLYRRLPVLGTAVLYS